MSTRMLLGPLLVVAIVAGSLGFVVQRGLTAPTVPDLVDVSVIALPPEPTPEPTPRPSPRPRVSVNGRTGGGRSDGSVSNCPAGCRCESRPPAGVVIICR